MKTSKAVLLSLSLLLFIGKNTQAQFGNVWTFGQGYGVDFNSGQPVQLPPNALNSVEGCASVSDSSGQLLFYTNGETIWDRVNNVMVNGDSIGGHQTSTQSSLILPLPSHNKMYYVLSINHHGNGGNQEMDFSIVDMSLNNSLGSVTLKNQFLEDSVCEKLAATRHCNGLDWWIMVRKANSDYFVSYLLTSQGLSISPIYSLSTIPFVATGSFGSTGHRYGQMKISPNGKFIACAYGNSGFEILNFNNLTGETGNVLFRDFNYPNLMAYGISFSYDSKKVFAGYNFLWPPPMQEQLNIVCYLLDTLIQQSIMQSRFFISINDALVPTYDHIFSLESFQLGPDKSVYGIGIAQDTILGGTRMLMFRLIGDTVPQIERMSFYFQQSGGNLGRGLPNTYDGIFTNHHKASFRLPLCNSPLPYDSIPFFDSLLTTTRDYSWDFGDPLSGVNNYSTLHHPIHQYAAIGTYTVSLTLESDCNPIVITQQVVVTQVPPAVPNIALNLGNLESSVADNYQWYFEGVAITGAVFQQYFPTQTGNYTVQITDVSGCTSSSVPFNVTSVLFKELQSINQFLLFQNATYLTLQCNPINDCFQSVELIDLQGRVLQTYTYQQKQSKVEINISELQSGVYLLRVNGREVRKVVKE
jgi:hypothetical protein